MRGGVCGVKVRCEYGVFIRDVVGAFNIRGLDEVEPGVGCERCMVRCSAEASECTARCARPGRAEATGRNECAPPEGLHRPR